MEDNESPGSFHGLLRRSVAVPLIPERIGVSELLGADRSC
jgi:hypothetical protein